jgi:hypothetical protein
VTLSFTFTLPALDTVAGQSVLPAALVKFDPFFNSPPLTLESREFPDWSRVAGAVSTVLSITAPDFWTVTRQPAELHSAWKQGRGSRVSKVSSNGHGLEVRTSLTLDDFWVAPSDWSAFRSFLIESGPRPNNFIGFSAATK